MIEGLLCMSGDDPRARALIDEIVDIYNEGKPPIQKVDYMTLERPETIVVIYHPLTGGIVLDRIRHALKPDVRRWVCHYIAIKPEARGKGFARGFVDLAKVFAEMNNGEFVGAYVDSGEQMDLWTKLGYPKQGNIGFTLAMFDRESEKLFCES